MPKSPFTQALTFIEYERKDLHNFAQTQTCSVQ
jgi:hypothetical protein